MWGPCLHWVWPPWAFPPAVFPSSSQPGALFFPFVSLKGLTTVNPGTPLPSFASGSLPFFLFLKLPPFLYLLLDFVIGWPFFLPSPFLSALVQHHTVAIISFPRGFLRLFGRRIPSCFPLRVVPQSSSHKERYTVLRLLACPPLLTIKYTRRAFFLPEESLTRLSSLREVRKDYFFSPLFPCSMRPFLFVRIVTLLSASRVPPSPPFRYTTVLPFLLCVGGLSFFLFFAVRWAFSSPPPVVGNS